MSSVKFQMLRHSRLPPDRHRPSGTDLRWSVKIFVDREQWIRLQLPKDSPQLLLNAVHRVKKVSPVDLQFARSQFPIGSEDKVIPEQSMFEIIQRAPRD